MDELESSVNSKKAPHLKCRYSLNWSCFTLTLSQLSQDDSDILRNKKNALWPLLSLRETSQQADITFGSPISFIVV